ncbi:MAG TPA: zinc dependent phospholipase C family protein [Bacteroidia bacterium]|nr:zinc dependent phospholipase C family protein [Bacteroidia bacterium]
MKRVGFFSSVLACSLLLFNSIPAFSWGFYAHKKINRMAVYGVPAPLASFYKKNIEYITQHAVDPDKKKFVDSAEGPHHYINLDHYGSNPFAVLPKYWTEAVKKYTEDSLNKYGTLPYEVIYWENKLTDAFRKKDLPLILRASANIGHYVADAHVPLHTITNYNGQCTNQIGIHGLWETAIPEAFGNTYPHINGGAVYLKDPAATIWNILKQTYPLAATVLSVEKEVSSHFTKDEKYLPHKNGEKIKYTQAYITAYNKALNGMVEKQLRSSAIDVASFWYTAWVNAGQPDLIQLRAKN